MAINNCATINNHIFLYARPSDTRELNEFFASHSAGRWTRYSR